VADLVVEDGWRHWEGCRVGKTIVSTPFLGASTDYAGLVESDGTPIVTDPSRLDEVTCGAEAIRAEVIWDGSSEPLDFSGVAVVGNALGSTTDIPGDGVTILEPPTIIGPLSATEYQRNNVYGVNPGHGIPVGSADFSRAVGLFSVPALVTLADNGHYWGADPEWDNPNVVDMEIHPDDIAAPNHDTGTVQSAWITTVLSNAINKADTIYAIGSVFVKAVPYNGGVNGVVQEGDPRFTGPIDRYYDESGVLTSGVDVGSFEMPIQSRPDDVAGYWYMGTAGISTADRLAHLTPGSIDQNVSIPVTVYSDIVADWSGGEGLDHLYVEPRLLVDFLFTSVRYRFIYASKPTAPHCRVWPREDSFGPSPRIWPQPRSIQTPGRAHGYM
jgi:hypothetical protein